MTTDANEAVDETVLTPKLNPNAGGIEEHLEKLEAAKSVQEPEATTTVDSSPTTEENQEQKTNGVQKRINDITAQRYQEQRRADALQQELEQLKAQSTVAPVAKQEDIKAPALPDDLYDDEAMRKYHAEMQKYSIEAAKQTALSQFESQQRQGAEKAQQAKQAEVLNQYTTNALRDGIDLDKLRVAEQTLNNAGLSAELGNHIMNDPNGAKIASYLADNPSEMYEILQQDVVSAGIRIATQIKPKVLSQTPKVSNAPDPIPEVSGGGFVEKDDFDKTYPGYEII